jgi:hypothetical protein
LSSADFPPSLPDQVFGTHKFLLENIMSTSPVVSSLLFQDLQAFAQQRTGLQQLGKSLDAGDLSGAQQAFNTIQSHLQSGQASNSVASNLSNARQEFAAVGRALQSGNLTGAQRALAELRNRLPAPPPANSTPDVGPEVIINLTLAPPSSATIGATAASSSTAATQPPATNTNPAAAGPEIILNLGKFSAAEQITIDINNSAVPAGSTSSSTGSASAAPPSTTPATAAGPEIVLNLEANSGNSTPEPITIDLKTASNGGEQLTFTVGSQQSPQEQVIFNVAQQTNLQIIFNLLNSTANSSSQGGLINISL